MNHLKTLDLVRKSYLSKPPPKFSTDPNNVPPFDSKLALADQILQGSYRLATKQEGGNLGKD